MFIFGVTVVLCVVKILSGLRNFLRCYIAESGLSRGYPEHNYKVLS